MFGSHGRYRVESLEAGDVGTLLEADDLGGFFGLVDGDPDEGVGLEWSPVGREGGVLFSGDVLAAEEQDLPLEQRPVQLLEELGVDALGRTVTATLNALDERLANAGEGDDAGSPRAPAAAQANPLGIVGEDLDAAQRSRLGLQAGEGVLIARVEGMAAREAGLRPGDVVLAVGRNDVGSANALNAQLRGLKPGQAVMLLVRRGGGTQYVTVDPAGE